MRPDISRAGGGASRRGPHRGQLPRWVLAAARVVLLAAISVRSLAAQSYGTPARVDNVARAVFVGADGTPGAVDAAATVFVRPVAGATLASSYDVVVPMGGRVVLSHVLTNNGTATDRFVLSTVAPAGWAVTVFVDVDGDGALTSADRNAAGAVVLDRGLSVPLLVEVQCPATAREGDWAAVTLRATSSVDNALVVMAGDRVSVRRATAPDILVTKAVDRATATTGDTLLYTMLVRNRGGAATDTNAILSDPLPGGLRYVPGTLLLGGAPLTDAVDGDAGSVAGGAIRVDLGVVQPGGSAEVSFRAIVTVAAGERGSLSNIASVTFGGPTAVVSSATSTAAETQLTFAALELAKELVGADSVIVGREARYRLRYANRSATPARNVVLVDSLPETLEYVSASPAPSAVQGRVITWQLGALDANASGTVSLVTRALRPNGAGGEVVNRAVVLGGNAAAAAASASSLRIGDWTGNELSLAKRAGVLDAAIGEPVPYVLTLRNTGWDALQGIVVRDELPAGTRLIPSALAGADSVRMRGGVAEFYLSALAPKVDHVVRYAVVLATAGSADMLQNRAVAFAEGGRVRSDTVVAWVKVRRGFAMQSRTLIGKVWVDRNDDGRQDAGEMGVANAQIITADGQVITTDKEGRFSLRDVRTGSHALRLDTLGLPSGLRLARRDDEVVIAQANGWTTPRVNFRLVPPDHDCSCEDSLKAAMLSPTSTAPTLTVPVVSPTVAPLRTQAEREAERRRTFVDGPVVRVAVPTDGAVVASNRVFVRVSGEGGARVKLFDGERLIGESTLRPDGSQDFIGVELASGTHRLRATMRNSFGRERWDSVAVHRSGAPATIGVGAHAGVLRLDAQPAMKVEARVLDEWNVPVSDRPFVTVDARNVRLDGTDADPSSVGEQRQVDRDGTLRLALRAGRNVGPGTLALKVGDVTTRIEMRVLPSARALVATGVGQVGIGAAPRNFGAVSVHGAVDDRTAVTVSFDTRRMSSEDVFAQGFNPLDESRMATYGDGSEQRAPAASTQRFVARVERDFDWIALGDVQGSPFGAGRLTSYSRALSGVSARVGTGAIVWTGFASMTAQRFAQQQLRGDGGSGPYVFGRGIRRGSDRVAIEVRDRANAGRVIARQDLAPFVDYTIDYVSGAMLLRRPVPSADPYGNPIFVVATMERLGGGADRVVGGLRAESDIARYVPQLGADSILLGVVGVRGGGAGVVGVGADADLFGADVTVRRGALQAGAELLRAQGGDSSAMAMRASARWNLGDAASLDADLLRVGSGFDRSLDPRLGAAMQEVRVGGELRLSPESRVALHHERQRFEQFGVERRVVRADAEQRVLGRRATQELHFATDMRDGVTGEGASVLAGKMLLAVTSRADVWAEGQHALRTPGGQAATRPDQVGLGATYRILQRLSLEAAHRNVWLGQDSVSYALSSLGLRTDGLLGGNAYTSIERAGSARASHAAVLGWNNRLSIAKGWAAHTLFERRVGLEKADLVDPVRALPFSQAERNRWSVGGGLEWLPGADRSRLSARAEMHDGADRSGYRTEIAGDAPLGSDAAFITYHDWSQYRRSLGSAAGREFSRMDRSLVGVAMRPASSDVFNALAKVEFRRSLNPLGSVLSTAATDERLIGAADAIWAPSSRTEVSTRYAIRWAGTAMIAGDAPIKAQSHFIGTRAERAITRAVALRTDARLLLEATSGTASWSAAPSVVWRADHRMELEAGWRAGPLVDRDFAANARTGLFAAVNLRFTERTLATPAAFWRERVSRGP